MVATVIHGAHRNVVPVSLTSSQSSQLNQGKSYILTLLKEGFSNCFRKPYTLAVCVSHEK